MSRTPCVTIDLDAVEANAAAVVRLCAAHGIRVLGVTKGAAGHPGVARAMLRGGVAGIGESRLANAERLRRAGVEAELVLLRIPSPSEADEIGGFRVVVAPVPGADPKALKAASKTLAAGGVQVMALVGEGAGGPPLYVGADKAAVEAGVAAKDLIGVLTGVLGGGGGGSPVAAQGKGKDADRVDEALTEVRKAIAEALG